MKMDKYQQIFGTSMVKLAIKRLTLGDIKPDLDALSDSDSLTCQVQGRPEMGDGRYTYQVSITKSVSVPEDLEKKSNARCSCMPRYTTRARRRNHCSHLLACEFYRLRRNNEEFEINEQIEQIENETYDVKFVVNQNDEIILERKDDYYIRFEEDWRRHFEYEGRVFYLRFKTWYNLLMAVDFLKKYCKVSIDLELFKRYFKAENKDIKEIEELARNVNIKVDGGKVFYYFLEGFEKHCSLNEIISFKKWEYIQQYKNIEGYLEEFPREKEMVQFEKEKTRESQGMFIFSTSIGLSLLFNEFLRTKGFIVSDLTTSPETFPFSLKPELEPRDYQHEAVNTWDRCNIGLIVSPSASGKTYMGAMAIAMKGVKTFILVHTKDLIEQWRTNLLQFLDIQRQDIGLYASGKKDVDNKKIIIATYQTLLRNLEVIGNLNVGLVIADECHHVPADTFQKVNGYINSPYKLGLTATPERPDGKEGGIFAFYNKIIYEVRTQDLVNEKYISPVVFYTLNIQDDTVSDALDLEGAPFELQKLRSLSTKSKLKYEALAELVKKLNQYTLGFIIFADRIEIAKKISSDLNIPFLSSNLSKDKREEIFRKLRGKEITGIVTAKLAGEGVDIPNLDCVIDFVPSKSNVMLLQKIGRTRRRTEEKRIGFYIQFVLMNVDLERKWANASYQNFLLDLGIVPRMSIRRVVDSVDNINFEIRRTIKAIEQRSENLLKKGEKSEKELLNFIKANPDTYFYEITKKLNWSKGKVARTMQRLERKGLIKKDNYLKAKKY
jgi:superfamily II DNA or RNA helicase